VYNNKVPKKNGNTKKVIDWSQKSYSFTLGVIKVHIRNNIFGFQYARPKKRKKKHLSEIQKDQ
jgi:hypothetical protein